MGPIDALTYQMRRQYSVIERRFRAFNFACLLKGHLPEPPVPFTVSTRHGRVPARFCHRCHGVLIERMGDWTLW